VVRKIGNLNYIGKPPTPISFSVSMDLARALRLVESNLNQILVGNRDFHQFCPLVDYPLDGFRSGIFHSIAVELTSCTKGAEYS
jgi:hypothetical protein